MDPLLQDPWERQATASSHLRAGMLLFVSYADGLALRVTRSCSGRPLSEALVQVGGAPQPQQLARRRVPHQPVQLGAPLVVDGVERRVPRHVQRLLLLLGGVADHAVLLRVRERVGVAGRLMDLVVVGAVLALLAVAGRRLELLLGRVPVRVGEDLRAGAALQPARAFARDGEVGGQLDQPVAAGADDERRAAQHRPAVVPGRSPAPRRLLHRRPLHRAFLALPWPVMVVTWWWPAAMVMAAVVGARSPHRLHLVAVAARVGPAPPAISQRGKLTMMMRRRRDLA
ncbi:Os03g0334250 [Oryza sativa Japonica Group]|uniref:Os03g0334250 protein n=1 Tax=Oryza sativa subsp. japonica TaxID=39947 RepID=A0A0P0VXY1_ORYSJ|nr:hypothetical protein EE612_017240 [Oryza sativa]BAS84067.1 Os03g0334250 [Oryza sativa Japonica Group]